MLAKFRVRDKKYGHIYDVSTLHFDNKTQAITYICAAYRGHGFLPEECDLIEFTGAFVDNGDTALWQGDIIKDDEGEYGLIIWDRSKYCWAIKWYGGVTEPLASYRTDGFFHAGNFFENPELLAQ